MRILAIDQGTSATKAIVVDDAGAVCALAEVPVRTRHGAGGAVEQDPDDLLSSVLSAGRQAIDASGGPVDVLALANQGESVLAWDRRTGEPLTPVIVWQDGRAQSVCDDLAAEADAIAARSGLVLDPYFSAPKVTWLRRNLTRDGVVTTTDTWLVHRLTGEFVTDVTTASRSLVLDIDRVDWDDELLAHFELTDEELPRLVACDEVIGSTVAFGAEIPVAGLVVDQQAALLAEGCIEPGQAKCTYGTGAFLLANVGDTAVRSSSGLTTSVAWRTAGRTAYCVDGQVYTAASAIHWLADLGLVADVRDRDASTAATSDGVTFSPALAGLAAPWWRSDARAAFVGMSLATDRGALVRAVVEGIAAQVADLAAVVGDDTGVPIARLRVDGGLTNSRVLMQAQADLLQVPVDVYPSAHATPLGAAALARMALDPSLTLDAVAGTWAPSATYDPRMRREDRNAFMDAWHASVQRVLPVTR